MYWHQSCAREVKLGRAAGFIGNQGNGGVARAKLKTSTIKTKTMKIEHAAIRIFWSQMWLPLPQGCIGLHVVALSSCARPGL